MGGNDGPCVGDGGECQLLPFAAALDTGGFGEDDIFLAVDGYLNEGHDVGWFGESTGVITPYDTSVISPVNKELDVVAIFAVRGDLSPVANQRKEGKVMVGFFATEEEKALLNEAARLAGFTSLADYLRWIARHQPVPHYRLTHEDEGETLKAAEDPAPYRTKGK